MPSGAKKRKAAKRRKEQEQQQQLGLHPPGSPTQAATATQGNGVREDDDDLMSHGSKGSESSSDSASPTAAHGNHHHRHHHHDHLEIGEEEKSQNTDSSVEAKIEDDLPGSDDMKVMDDIVKCGRGEPSESALQKIEETVNDREEVAVAPVDVNVTEIAQLASSDPISHASVEVPIAESQTTSVEQVQSEEDKDDAASGEVIPPIELKQSEAVDTASVVVQPVPIPTNVEVAQGSATQVESCEVNENIAVTPSNVKEEKLSPLANTTSEQLDPTVESHPGSGSCEITSGSEVVRSAQMERRASWMSCCGLFDVIESTSR